MNRIIAEYLSPCLINRRINIAVNPFNPPFHISSDSYERKSKKEKTKKNEKTPRRAVGMRASVRAKRNTEYPIQLLKLENIFVWIVICVIVVLADHGI